MGSSRHRPGAQNFTYQGGAGGVEYVSAYAGIDFRKNPELYRVGYGEQGVLLAEPFKSEILSIGWYFKTPDIASESSRNILNAFYRYMNNDEFVGADLSRKFLQMGFSRARRYANHKSGRKWSDEGTILPQEPDALTSSKAESARIFYAAWKEAEAYEPYKLAKVAHIKRYGRSALSAQTKD